MLQYVLEFDNMIDAIPKWNWSELKEGLEKSIIKNENIISYAIRVLSEEIEQFELVLELSIAEDYEVESLLSQLIVNENIPSAETIDSKWMFAIIYDAYSRSKETIYDVIEDVYAEFNYPEEIRNLVRYMPNKDSCSLDIELDEYISKNKTKWCE